MGSCSDVVSFYAVVMRLKKSLNVTVRDAWSAFVAETVRTICGKGLMYPKPMPNTLIVHDFDWFIPRLPSALVGFFTRMNKPPVAFAVNTVPLAMASPTFIMETLMPVPVEIPVMRSEGAWRGPVMALTQKFAVPSHEGSEKL